MGRNARGAGQDRSSIGKLLIAVLAVLVVIVIGVGLMRHFEGPSDTGPTETPSSPEAEGPKQPGWCPSVEFISAPGTWESSPDDDPLNPTFNPMSFMLSVTNPLKERYPEGEPGAVKIWTVPYTAQFKNLGAMHEMGYDKSRTEGANKVAAELTTMHEQCPLTDFVMAGFSQGAVLLGDIANEIGTQDIPVPAERIRGVALVADGRREPGVGQTAGIEVRGVGAEVSLQSLNGLAQVVTPGATMRGPRPGGFGSLNDRVFEICAPDDSICDAPLGVDDAIGRAQALVDANGVHAMYATNPVVFEGTTTNQWLVRWAENLIGAP